MYISKLCSLLSLFPNVNNNMFIHIRDALLGKRRSSMMFVSAFAKAITVLSFNERKCIPVHFIHWVFRTRQHCSTSSTDSQTRSVNPWFCETQFEGQPDVARFWNGRVVAYTMETAWTWHSRGVCIFTFVDETIIDTLSEYWRIKRVVGTGWHHAEVWRIIIGWKEYHNCATLIRILIATYRCTVECVG